MTGVLLIVAKLILPFNRQNWDPICDMYRKAVLVGSYIFFAEIFFMKNSIGIDKKSVIRIEKTPLRFNVGV